MAYLMLEKMAEFFENRIDGYDEHMLNNIDGADEFYPFTAANLPMKSGQLFLIWGATYCIATEKGKVRICLK